MGQTSPRGVSLKFSWGVEEIIVSGIYNVKMQEVDKKTTNAQLFQKGHHFFHHQLRVKGCSSCAGRRIGDGMGREKTEW